MNQNAIALVCFWAFAVVAVAWGLVAFYYFAQSGFTSFIVDEPVSKDAHGNNHF